MPKGIPAAKGGSTMTVEELNEAAARVEGKISPFNSQTVIENGEKRVVRAATPVRPAPASEIVGQDGSVRTVVGMFTKPAKMGDSGTLRRFAHVPADRTNWIEMTVEEAAEYEKQRILIGFDPDQGLGFLSRQPSPFPSKKGI